MTKPTSGYVNGSDILLSVGGKAVGHCTTHTITFNSETKDRAVKPAAANGYSAGLWKGKGVTGLSISISAEGLRFYGETENGFTEIAAKWGKELMSERVTLHLMFLVISLLPQSRKQAPPRMMPLTLFS